MTAEADPSSDSYTQVSRPSTELETSLDPVLIGLNTVILKFVCVKVLAGFLIPVIYTSIVSPTAIVVADEEKVAII